MTADQLRAVVYSGFAFVCLAVAWHESPNGRKVPVALAVLALLIVAGEALGIGAAITSNLRSMAGEGGWYGQRRFVQGVVLGVMTVAAIAAAVLTWQKTQAAAAAYAIPATAMCFHLAYLLGRTTSFHYADAWLEVDMPVPGIHFHQGDALEILSCVVIGALVWRAYAARSRVRGGYQETIPAP